MNKSGLEFIAENEPTNQRDEPTISDKIESNQTLEEFWSKQDGELPRQVTAVVVGAGLRGQNYANFALDFPSRLKIVGVAEPQKHRREKLQKSHDIPDEYALDDWSKLAILDKIADLAIISTQDHMHKDPAIAFANLGYHLLLEKPMAVKEIDCEQIAESCERNKVMAAVGHVMRYVYRRKN
ncbi:4,5-dihydroxyphthalate dehydrogenase [Paramuricea clavata]|uniref:4,5-dihydroxyphthalate dehydrogenase n=1 Tax=Paramuricea clavata TaxID=317549 RepID=A0A7D9L2C7_PARCT|nr:4,5-dihydroxyphthalate dehydrogenase [Paramuricea clavata]